jgi:ABC-type maltose transport system permease subunit
MTTLLALSRPTEWNLPLFVHVLGAMILVGGLLTGATAIAFARGDARFLRLGYWTLLAVALPGWVVMFAGANWIYVKEGWDDVSEENTPTWLGLGWTIALLGAILVVLALIVGGIGMRRLRTGGGQGLLKAAMVIAWLVLAAALVAVWAMAGKPD